MSPGAPLQLKGKLAVITGASSGIGLGITRRFLAEGASVVMLARGQQRLESVAAGLGERAIPIATDVGNPDSVRAAFDQIGARFKKLDVLINNAGIYRPCAVEKLNDHEIERQIATNFAGSRLHVARGHPAAARRGGRRHREHVE